MTTKPETLRGILIDPFMGSISYIELENTLEGIYWAINCDCVSAIGLGAGHTLWIDDEGLFKDDQKFFEVRGFEQPIAGRALILKTTESGDSASVDPRLTLEMVKKEFSFVELEEYPEPKIEFYSF